LRSLARRVTNLPAQLSEIVGREQDVAAIRELLDRSRLVTITGAGGTGKTRLAQEVARLIVEDGGMDAAFVPLQALSDAELIPVEILRALHLDVAAARDPLERIVEHFAERRALLVLDNLEQLDGAGTVVRALLDGTSGLAVLAASQAALHVAGEREYALGTLPVPEPTEDLEALAANASVRLFVDRARAVRADFALDAANAGAIVALSAKLDGLPLAIELAAAQSKLLSPRAILDRIAGRLDALASRRDDLPARQRTLRATVAWSYELLGDAERRLFRRLAAFTGGARLSEIEAIAGYDPAVPSPVDVLGTLVDRSLVTTRPGQLDDDRFGLLETMRIYGRELLREHGEEAAVLEAHATIYRRLAHEAEPEFYRASRRAWLDRLAGDHDNLRAALDHMEASGDIAAGLDMVADLWRFWYSRGHLLEGRERVDRLLAAASAPGVSVSAYVLSRAVEAAGSIRYWTRQKDEQIETYYQRAVELARESGDRSREAWATYNLAFVFDFTTVASLAEPDEARALELRSRALAMFREQGDRRGVAESLWALGGNAIVTREGPERARRFLGEASELLTELGDDYGLSWVHVSAGMIEANEGNLDVALDHVLRGAEVFVRDGDAAGEVLAVQAIASLAARRGDDVTAVRFAAAAHAATRELGADLPQIPPIVDPITELWARFPADDLRREAEVGVALGVKAILANALAQLDSPSG
jgi:predicted ATPase